MDQPGSLSFATLQKTYVRGYSPPARILIQEILPTGRAGSRLRELKGWTGFSISRAIGTMGRASITLSNVFDSYFDSHASRQFDALNSDAMPKYLADIYGRALPFVREINPRRRSTPIDGFRSFATSQDIQRYIKFIYTFRGALGEFGLKSSDQADMISLGLMQRAIIDVQGPDGLWYAVFTGLVSGIEDVYVAGQVPIINLNCVDYWRLFSLSEIITKPGPGPIQDNIDFQILTSLGYTGATFQSSIFQGLDGIDILHILLDLTQRSLCYAPFILQQKGFSSSNALDESNVADFSVTYVPGGPNELQPDDFFQTAAFWQIPFYGKLNRIQGNYLGLPCLRRTVPGVQMVSDPNSEENTIVAEVVESLPDGAMIPDGFPVAGIGSTFLVDAYMRKGKQGEVYRRLFDQILSPWQSQRTMAETIIKKVAEATYYDVYFNSNGDLVYQIPKYNNMPGEYSPTIEVKDIGQQSQDFPVTLQGPTNTPDQELLPESVRYTYDFTKRGFFDYAPLPDNFATKSHGFNYVITDLGLRDWHFHSTEESIVTDVRVPAGQDFLASQGESIDIKFNTGRTSLADTQKLQRRFGVRVMETQQIFIPNLYGTSNEKALIDTFATAVLQQVNGRAFTGAIRLSSRPDLDIGKNILAAERECLYYVVGQSYTHKFGEDAVTALTLSYGHDPATLIPSPWITINERIGTKPSKAVSQTGQGATKQSPSVPDDKNDFETPSLTNQSVFGIDSLISLLEVIPNATLNHTKPSTTSTGSKYIDVDPSVLSAQAQAVAQTIIPGIVVDTDTYSLARTITSEQGESDPSLIPIKIAIGYATINAAAQRGWSITRRLAFHKSNNPPLDGHYGEQTGRFASTLHDPTMKDLVIARACINKKVGDPANGSVQYFDPKGQADQWTAVFKTNPAKVYDINNPALTATNQKSPSDICTLWSAQNAWRGEIPGIKTTRFMVFVQENSSQKRKEQLDAAIAFLRANNLDVHV